ncbi:MAG: CopD family protein [Spirochaetota bacterium]|nr:CopD family protein [Spirochaetota bacterium]
MTILYVKALHIVFMVTWFAGLFYLVRLFIYLVEAENKSENEKTILKNQLTLMTSRLLYIITWPGMMLTIAAGVWLMILNPGLLEAGWFHIKLLLLLVLIGYHLYCERIFSNIKAGRNMLSSGKLRLYNEVSTVLLFAIVFLAVLKSYLSLAFALSGLVILIVTLMLGMAAYKKLRNDKA